ncbi:MAG: polysaccharide pyruvyl transferase family protein [Pseudomonadota bacterium]|nr:polysaccharide pyruvyl transferase family protein [Pseudomonadota bacterium]MEE3099935.1 polysaccharide pyruvyl transferase family protein [Pseudomonadota bacterium]
MTGVVDKLAKKAASQWFYKVGIKRLGRATDQTRIDVHHWRPKGAANFGDELSLVVVDQLLALRGLHRAFHARAPQTLFAIGSILQMAREGDTVWGSGVNGRDTEREPGFSTLDVRAVRGPKTREWLNRWRPEIHVPEVYGDPGLLVFDLFPDLLTRRTLQSYPETIFIPNLNDLRLKELDTSFPIVSPLEPWPLVCEYIVNARNIVTSSLHGFVLGERLGKDVKLVRLSSTEPAFKYEDYVLGTGRTDGPRVFSTVAEAAKTDMTAAPVLPPPGLREAFPYDLWD